MSQHILFNMNLSVCRDSQNLFLVSDQAVNIYTDFELMYTQVFNNEQYIHKCIALADDYDWLVVVVVKGNGGKWSSTVL